MNVKFSGGPPRVVETARKQGDNVEWLPRARLRSGMRRDRLITGLTILIAAVLALAAGVAAWSRHDGAASVQVTSADQTDSADKTVEQAPAVSASAPVVPEASPFAESEAAPVVTAATPAPQPAQPEVAEASRPSEAPSVFSPAPWSPLTPPAPQQAPDEPAPERVVAAPAEPEPEPAPSSPSGAATLADAPEPVEPPAAIPGEMVTASDPPLPPPREVEPDLTPQRTAALAAPAAPAGGKVAVYLDEFSDQKAAAAGLAQKAPAYSPLIGSAGKLTYSRRNSNVWRLRVSNLDQATAEALCGKFKGAGAPCSVGPN